MEQEGLLNVDDALDLWVLHYCFMQAIAQSLEMFVHAWNNHPVRTPGCGNMSPEMMWIDGP